MKWTYRNKPRRVNPKTVKVPELPKRSEREWRLIHQIKLQQALQIAYG
jgi:hypothetical protein